MGQLPPSLGNLASLTSLCVPCALFFATLPQKAAPRRRASHRDASRAPADARPAAVRLLRPCSDLGDNFLVGPLPASLGALPRLQTLRVDGNQLSGALPPSLAAIAGLSLCVRRARGRGSSAPGARHAWSSCAR